MDKRILIRKFRKENKSYCLMKCLVCGKKFGIEIGRYNDGRGFTCSLNCRDKRHSALMKGRKLTEKHKDKIRRALKGKMPKNIKMIAGWNKDKKMSKEYCERVRRLNLVGKIGMLDKKHTEQTKKKMRRSNKTKELWKNPEYREHMKKAHRGKMIGKENPAYVDGRTPLVQRVRHSWRYQEWVRVNFERDNYTCQDCGARGVKLVVHHKKSFSKIWTENKIKTLKQAMNCKELWDIENGKTLCEDCHGKYNTRQ